MLAQAIVREGMKFVAAGMNPMDLKRGIDKAVTALVAELKKAPKPTTTSKGKSLKSARSRPTAMTRSARSLLMQWKKSAKEGVITVEDGKSSKTSSDVVEGMQFDRGYISPYFINNPDKQLALMDNPYVLLHDKRSRTSATCCRRWNKWPRLVVRC